MKLLGELNSVMLARTAQEEGRLGGGAAPWWRFWHVVPPSSFTSRSRGAPSFGSSNQNASLKSGVSATPMRPRRYELAALVAGAWVQVDVGYQLLRVGLSDS